MFNWTGIAAGQSYADLRYAFLLATEEGGNVKLAPYNDNRSLGVKGLITIASGSTWRELERFVMQYSRRSV